MTKLIGSILLCSIVSTAAFCVTKYEGNTTACVTMAGGIIKAQHAETNKKYKRSECPVCKGKGWYISGDGIAKVDCGYCEPDNKPEAIVTEKNVSSKPRTIIHKR